MNLLLETAFFVCFSRLTVPVDSSSNLSCLSDCRISPSCAQPGSSVPLRRYRFLLTTNLTTLPVIFLQRSFLSHDAALSYLRFIRFRTAKPSPCSNSNIRERRESLSARTVIQTIMQSSKKRNTGRCCSRKDNRHLQEKTAKKSVARI